MKELSITPRDYQNTIFQTCKEKDCLVILPTGTGKTLIALMLAIERFKKLPLEKIVILAPTKRRQQRHRQQTGQRKTHIAGSRVRHLLKITKQTAHGFDIHVRTSKSRKKIQAKLRPGNNTQQQHRQKRE